MSAFTLPSDDKTSLMFKELLKPGPADIASVKDMQEGVTVERDALAEHVTLVLAFAHRISVAVTPKASSGDGGCTRRGEDELSPAQTGHVRVGVRGVVEAWPDSIQAACLSAAYRAKMRVFQGFGFLPDGIIPDHEQGEPLVLCRKRQVFGTAPQEVMEEGGVPFGGAKEVGNPLYP